MILPYMRIAGVTIAGLGNEPHVVPIATLEDWIECLERARHRLSTGASVMVGEPQDGVFPGRPHGPLTWEEALAWCAASLLGSGTDYTHNPALGRPDPWPDGEEQRWIDAVFAVAELGSTHEHTVGIETTDTPTADVWLLEGPDQPPLAFRRRRFALSGTVQTMRGRVALDSLPRTPR